MRYEERSDPVAQGPAWHVHGEVAFLGYARIVAHLVLVGGDDVRRFRPVRSGDLALLAGGGVVMTTTGRGDPLRYALHLDVASVRSITAGRLPRGSRRLRPWTESRNRPSRLAHVVGGWRDLVLVHARPTTTSEHEALWALELWRTPTPAARGDLRRLSSSGDWPPPLESSVSPGMLRKLLQTARRGGHPDGIRDLPW